MAEMLPPGIVVVTGASSGIGRELVALLLDSGREVVGLARRADTAGQGDPPCLGRVSSSTVLMIG